MAQPIDNRLIARCLRGERPAQRALYERLLPTLSLVAKRYLQRPDDVKDVLQETFISIFKHLGQYDAGRAAFLTWATRITINACLRQNRRCPAARESELLEERDAPAVAPSGLTNLTNAELIAFLRRMPPDFYAVFSLHVIDGFTHAEIATSLGIDPALSRQRLTRARAWLRRHLPPEYGTVRHLKRRPDAGTVILPLLPLILQFLAP